MSVYDIPCPVCKGKKRYEYTTIYGYVRTGTCTACKGSGKMELAPQAFERRIREYGQEDKRHEYKPKHALKPEEIRIIGKFKTIRQTLDDLATAGYVRTESSIKRVRFLIKRGDMTIPVLTTVTKRSGI